MRSLLTWVGLVSAAGVLAAAAAERKFDFSEAVDGRPPAAFRSTVSGTGKPGDWRIILDEVPSLLPPITPGVASHARRPVLAQLSQDPADEHYPLLVLEDEVFADFTLTTRFKLVGGTNEQMAGIAFRIQDEKNYYYVRASGLGGTFYFFKFVKGELIGPIGSKAAIAPGVWHDLGVECHGSEITCSLDGKPVIPKLLDTTFTKGKIGFWTKSDSVSYFAATRMEYKPVIAPVQTAVADTLKKYSLLLGLKLYVAGPSPQSTRVVAAKDRAEIGQAGGTSELGTLTHGTIYYGKEQDAVSVVMPLRDRNGEITAALRLRMRSFAGQTEQNALGRAQPIAKHLETRLLGLKDLVD